MITGLNDVNGYSISVWFHQHLGLVDVQAREEAGHELLWRLFLQSRSLLGGLLLLFWWGLRWSLLFGFVLVFLLLVLWAAVTNTRGFTQTDRQTDKHPQQISSVSTRSKTNDDRSEPGREYCVHTGNQIRCNHITSRTL